MTKRGRPTQQVGTLKALLLTGSVIATLAGTQLLPLKDAAATETQGSTSAPVTVVIPTEPSSTITLPPGDRRTQLTLKPIPQAVQPQIRPVVRARSSR